MSKINNFFTKIYVFDINPGNDDVTKDVIMGRLSKIIKVIEQNQFVVLISHSSLRILKKIVKDAKLKHCYIISDNGARIYNAGSGKILWEKAIDETAALSISRIAATNDLLQLASYKNNELIYSFDQLSTHAFAKMHYINLMTTSNFLNYKDQIIKNKIYSFLCFQHNTYDFENIYSDLLTLQEDLNIKLIKISESSFQAFHKDVCKYKSLIKIMKLKNITDFKNVYYYGLNSIDFECYNTFKNHLISIYAYYEAKMVSKNIYTVPYNSILDSLLLTFKKSNLNKLKRKNSFKTPDTLIDNVDEKIFNTEEISLDLQ